MKRAFIGVLIGGLLIAAWYAAPWRDECGALPDFDAIIETEARKAAFIAYVVPRVERANRKVEERRRKLVSVDAGLAEGKAPGAWRRYWVRSLARDYGIEDVESVDRDLLVKLLRRVDTVPTSLAVAQAAIESGWGGARFAREGGNLFGLRTHARGEGLVPRERAAGQRFKVASYGSVCEGIDAYIQNFNTHYRYRSLRTVRATLRAAGLPASGDRLAYELVAYSERGLDYVAQVRAIIAQNDLGRLDS
jgi:Bax protein